MEKRLAKKRIQIGCLRGTSGKRWNQLLTKRKVQVFRCFLFVRPRYLFGSTEDLSLVKISLAISYFEVSNLGWTRTSRELSGESMVEHSGTIFGKKSRSSLCVDSWFFLTNQVSFVLRNDKCASPLPKYNCILILRVSCLNGCSSYLDPSLQWSQK